MITKEEIRGIPELHKSIQRDKEQLHYLREKATCIPSSFTGEERVQTSPSNHGNKYIEMASDMNKEILAKEAELLDIQKRAGEFINTITDTLAKRVMKLRYLKCESWQSVSELTGYTERRVQQIEREVVQKL